MSSGKHAVPAVSAVAAVAATAAAVPAVLSGTVAPAVPAARMSRAVLDAEVVHQVVPGVRPLVTRIIHESARKVYTVVSGDTLSGIAGRLCGSAGKWPALFNGNRRVVKNPDMIFPGQKFRMTCDGSMVLPAVAAAAVAPVIAARQADGDGDHDGDISDAAPSAAAPATGLDADGDHDHDNGDGAVAQQAAPRQATAAVTGASGTIGSGPWPGGAFGNCVVQRESGGNSQVMNSSGHYGLYQFSLSTWEAYGGSAASFGHASVAEQERVFLNALAQGGQSNWSPYDGC